MLLNNELNAQLNLATLIIAASYTLHSWAGNL